PSSASTITATGQGVALASDNLAGYTLWGRGGNFGGDAILQIAGSPSNRGVILLQSADSNYQSNIATGSSTLTNVGTISSGGGSGGSRIISGTLDNRATVDATADYLEITGTYIADAGTILGAGYLYNCTLDEAASPSSPSTITATGQGVALATDNL